MAVGKRVGELDHGHLQPVDNFPRTSVLHVVIQREKTLDRLDRSRGNDGGAYWQGMFRVGEDVNACCVPADGRGLAGYLIDARGRCAVQ